MARLDVIQFPCLDDNYGFLVRDPETGACATIDTPDASAIQAAAAQAGWKITEIWNTHWHPDHAGGNGAIKAETGAMVTAPSGENGKIAIMDKAVSGGDRIQLGSVEAHVIDVGGHTLGHIAYYFPEAKIAFVGDALFALGCGRMFEGTAPQFWASLSRLAELPDDTVVYCAHEYTASNARFAMHADPDNAALAAYVAEITEKRAKNLPTVPLKLALELETNPFLRADAPAMQARWGGNAPHETFAAIRAAKDTF